MISFPWWLSFAIGFLSLSEEILWVRLVGFGYSGVPQSFSFVLASFLLGIAGGAALGKYFCSRSPDLYRVAAMTLAVAGALALSILSLPPPLLRQPHFATIGLTSVLIVVTAAAKSVLFPIAHHLGSQQSGPRVGSSVAKVYFGN